MGNSIDRPGDSPTAHRLARRLIWSALAAVLASVAVLFSAAYAGTQPQDTDGRAPARETARRDPFVERTAAPTPSADSQLVVAADHDRPVVVLYGDSLAWEARDHFVQRLTDAGAQVETRTVGGTAICDLLDAMRTDAATLHPDAVVVEFSGNVMTPCISDRATTGEGVVAAYRADAETVLDIFPTTAVYFAGAPSGRPTAQVSQYHGGAINTLYQRMAAEHRNVRYVDSGAAVLLDGQWTETLPCRDDEPCTGGVDARGREINVVRSPDGSHFCPAADEARDGVTGECRVWSSGAFRYGSAMADAVADDLPSTAVISGT